MPFHADLAAAVGNTPLIRLNKVSEATGCEILGKAEFLNPGQSVKDRAALFIIRDAIAKGTLRPGGTIVEGTAGNTGIGLALVGASMGFSHGDRDPRDPEPGKEGHDPAGGRGAGRGAGGTLRRPQQLRALFGASGRAAGAVRARRSDLGQPVRQRGEPAGPCGDDRPGNLERHRGPRARLHLRKWGRAGPSRAWRRCCSPGA